MESQVRWWLESKKKEFPDEDWAWHWFPGIYEGWFYGSDTTPSESILQTLEENRADYTHLDFRVRSAVRSRGTKTYE